MKPFSDPHYNNDDFESFSKPNKLSSVILKCGNPGTALIGQQLLGTAFPAITLNTSSLSKSCIKFNFTSNIFSFRLFGTLTFQLYKLCDNQIRATTVGPQWTFTRSDFSNTITAFSFSVYDHDICSSEKCHYYVMTSPPTVIDGDAVITNAVLSAIAVDNFSDKLINESIINDTDYPCFRPNLEQHPTILKCGTPQSTLFPAEINENLTTTETVASVIVNTSCFCKPCILLEYVSNIIVPIATGIFSMSFQVFKHCSNQFKPIPVGTQLNFQENRSTHSFSFSICDRNPCVNECCTYTVQVTAIIFGGGGPVIVENSTLSAIVVDNINEKC